MDLQELKEKLKKAGYNVTIPAGGNRIAVMGYGKSYFQAKKAKAASITSELISQGYNVKTVKDADGYYDFWVSLT
jgi:hypothetical protein